ADYQHGVEHLGRRKAEMRAQPGHEGVIGPGDVRVYPEHGALRLAEELYGERDKQPKQEQRGAHGGEIARAEPFFELFHVSALEDGGVFDEVLEPGVDRCGEDDYPAGGY